MRTKERLITVADAFGVIKRFFVLLLAVAILSAALGYATAFLSKTEYYEASAEVIFHTATADMVEGPDANDISRARALAASCAEVFPNDTLIDNIRTYFSHRRLDRPDENWEDLRAYSDSAISGMLSAAVEASSQKLTIIVKAPTAALACHLANAAAGELQVSITDTVGNCRIKLTSQAKSARLYSDFSIRPAVTSAIVSTALAYLALFAYAFFDPRLRSLRDLKNLSEDGAVIGAVGARRAPLALLDGSESPAVRESYNTARVTLLSRLSELDTEHPVIGIGGIGRAEDIPLLTANLATSIARLSRRVLVVDADYRSSSLAATLLPAEEKSTDEAPTVIALADGADLLSRGAMPENPADFLGSPAFRALLDAHRESYDLILVRLPSITETADAMHAAPVLDAALIGVSLAGDRGAKLAEATARLETVHTRLLGILATEH